MEKKTFPPHQILRKRVVCYFGGNFFFYDFCADSSFPVCHYDGFYKTSTVHVLKRLKPLKTVEKVSSVFSSF